LEATSLLHWALVASRTVDDSFNGDALSETAADLPDATKFLA
jgi:hypothetical protein